jgi:hypothetical protein
MEPKNEKNAAKMKNVPYQKAVGALCISPPQQDRI